MTSNKFNDVTIDVTPIDIIQSLRLGLENSVGIRDVAIDKDQFNNGRLKFEMGDFDADIAVIPVKIDQSTGEFHYKIEIKISNDAFAKRDDVTSVIGSMFKRMQGFEYFDDAKKEILNKLKNPVFSNASGSVILDTEKRMMLKSALNHHNGRGQRALKSALDI